jgi:hypothetical protein
MNTMQKEEKINKALPVIGLGGLKCWDVSRTPQCLYNWFIVDDYVVSLTPRPRFTPRNIFWCSVLLEAI